MIRCLLIACVLIVTCVPPSHAAVSLGVYINPPPDYTTEINSFFGATRRHAIVQYALLWDSNGAVHTNIMNMVHASGATPMCMWGSIGYSYPQILSGAVDDIIADIARAIKNYGGTVILAPDGEFNLDSSPHNAKNYGYRPETYGEVWRHVRGVFDAAGVTNVQWAWAPAYASWPSDAWNDYNRYYPGDAYVDWVGALGFDCNWSTGPANMTLDNIFKPILSDFQTRYPKKPQMLAWFGTAGSSSYAAYKASWIQQSYATIPSYPNLRAVVWLNDFNAGTPGPLDFRVWTSLTDNPVPASVTAAYKGAIAGSSFLETLPPYDQLIPGGGGGGGGSGGFTITLDRSTAKGGDPFVISWSFSGISRVVDAYLAAECPNGTLLVMDSKMDFQSRIVPGAASFDVSGNPAGVLNQAVPQGTTPGTYTLMAVCVPAGSSVLNPANYLGSGISSAPLTVQ
ncbi:MAG: glycosyl hydrolase [Candidatus Aureabacteria bacterium]|nr:glycosyl hydrolase [Candidatus Auribacterota bacterium]